MKLKLSYFIANENKLGPKYDIVKNNDKKTDKMINWTIKNSPNTPLALFNRIDSSDESTEREDNNFT